MFFTLEDYKKIYDWIRSNSIKDTEFNNADTPLKDTDTITLVLNNTNVRVSLKDFTNQLFLMGVSDFLNISHKYGEYYITLQQAIELIPYNSRKRGQVITFLDENDNWRIYLFRGEINQWSILQEWLDILDFEPYIVNSILPDEEDLTKVSIDDKGNYVTKFKDKKYDPENFSGMATKILRKRIIEIDDPLLCKVKKNILTLDDFDKENCIYEIRYDFDLNSLEITIPINCVLKFNGGTLNNGILIGDNTYIESYIYTLFTKENNIQILGNWSNTEIPVEWFGITTYSEDNSPSFQYFIDIFKAKILVFGKGIYKFGSEIVFNDGFYTIKGVTADWGASNKGTSLCLNKDFTGQYLFRWNTKNNTYFRSINILNLGIDCNHVAGGILTCGYDSSSFKNINITNVPSKSIGFVLSNSQYPTLMGTPQTVTVENIWSLKDTTTGVHTQPAIKIYKALECTFINVKAAILNESTCPSMYISELVGCTFITCAFMCYNNAGIFIGTSANVTFETPIFENVGNPIETDCDDIRLYGSATIIPLGTKCFQSNGFEGYVYLSTKNGVYLWNITGQFDKNLPLEYEGGTVLTVNSVKFQPSRYIYIRNAEIKGENSAISYTTNIKHITDSKLELNNLSSTENYLYYKYNIDSTAVNNTIYIPSSLNLVKSVYNNNICYNDRYYTLNSYTNTIPWSEGILFLENKVNFYTTVKITNITDSLRLSPLSFIIVKLYLESSNYLYRILHVVGDVSVNNISITPLFTNYLINESSQLSPIQTGSRINNVEVNTNSLYINMTENTNANTEWTLRCNVLTNIYISLNKEVTLIYGDKQYKISETQRIFLLTLGSIMRYRIISLNCIVIDFIYGDVKSIQLTKSISSPLLISTVGTSLNRPSSELILTSFIYFDTTLNKPIWWNGTKWVDATGADV